MTKYEAVCEMYYFDESADKLTEEHCEKVAHSIGRLTGQEVTGEYVSMIFHELHVGELSEMVLLGDYTRQCK